MNTPDPAQHATVIEMSQAEWDAAVQDSFDRLHLTYEELSDMARRRDFTSWEARKLWVVVGDQEQEGWSGPAD
jgi:hypothetical protein